MPLNPAMPLAPLPPQSGVLVLDKPEGITSFGVVARVRKALGIKKIGHCGTLDPFATGVLVVCLNQATRIVDQLLDQDKTYRFTLALGVETDTLDRTGTIVRRFDGPPCSRAELESALARFRGSFLQEVPRYAAVKVQGQRLYELTRKGRECSVPPRQVQVFRLELLAFDWPNATLEVHCSKGTYVRQLATDLGQLLGCGAHVAELRRLQSGAFGIDQAMRLEALQERPERALAERLIPMTEALSHLPAAAMEDQRLLDRLFSGHLDPDWEARERDRFHGGSSPVCILGEGQLAALWWPWGAAEQRRLRVFHR